MSLVTAHLPGLGGSRCSWVLRDGVESGGRFGDRSRFTQLSHTRTRHVSNTDRVSFWVCTEPDGGVGGCGYCVGCVVLSAAPEEGGVWTNKQYVDHPVIHPLSLSPSPPFHLPTTAYLVLTFGDSWTRLEPFPHEQRIFESPLLDSPPGPYGFDGALSSSAPRTRERERKREENGGEENPRGGPGGRLLERGDPIPNQVLSNTIIYLLLFLLFSFDFHPLRRPLVICYYRIHPITFFPDRAARMHGCRRRVLEAGP